MMYLINKIKHPGKVLYGVLILLLSFAAEISAQAELNPDNSPLGYFVVTPGQCVAIVQGDDCYLDVKISWQSKQAGEYCLYSSQQSKALRCWQQSQRGELSKEFVLSENVELYFKSQKDGQVLAKEFIEMAWVYQKNGRSRASWRMF
ncbi:DUF3019 domain-containing protein [Thalassomonas haliotis]|uniref:DUF3019 domain-containing protein n=1 Tax=Thalassomonas haliotis TaxID=485448 RepID=A0ABY7VDY7_9GAMM|nr:DUF3019 domain-containing protein [Thalassomonas haliotis]WDE11897.1 DUF3019 domain-containing protein [Thalassomonas haliotis]